jgi:hypothetical protein
MDSSAPRSSGSPALSLTTIAGKPAPTRDRAYAETVGASLLAMDSSAPRSSGSPALSLTTIAGKPAPTGDRAHAKTVGASLLAMDSSAPRLSSSYAISLTTIAGKPAPTRDHAHAETPNKNGRPAGRPFFLYPKLSIQPIKCSPSAMASAIHALVKSRTLGERKAF